MNPRAVNLSVVVALHVAVIMMLLAHAPTRRALAEAAPVFVRFIDVEAPKLASPPTPKPTEREPPRPVEKPRPIAKPKPATPVITAAPTPTAPPTFEAPPAPPKPEPPAESSAPVAPQAPAAAAASAPAPAVVPPSFNADYLHNPAPAYPALSRRLGEEGRVVVRVFVSVEGQAERVEMRSSSGHPRLDEVALDTVRKWKFVPAKQGDKPVAAWVLVPISFSLRG